MQDIVLGGNYQKHIESSASMRDCARECIQAGMRKFLLLGDLGAGKTVFVTGIAQALGIDGGSVHSPTYTYLSQHKNLLHADLYRLDDRQDLLYKGLTEAFDAAEYVGVERPRWCEEYADEEWFVVDIQRHDIDENTRIVRIQQYSDAMASQIHARLMS